MPPRARITREMVVEAAVEVIRREGAESLNARSVAGELGCSTQPVMYHFSTIEALKRAAYQRADRMHTDFLMGVSGEGDPLLEIGLNYIRFAVREPRLFRFLFQSGYAAEKNIPEIIASEALAPVLSVLQEALGTGPEAAREVLLTLAMFAHGCASLIANNGLELDEDLAAAQLERVFRGAILAMEEEGR